MIALIGLRDQLIDLAVRDLVEDAIALADRQQNGVEHFVDAFDHVAIGALERGGIAAFDSRPWWLNSVSLPSSAWNARSTVAMPLTFCFIFS